MRCDVEMQCNVNHGKSRALIHGLLLVTAKQSFLPIDGDNFVRGPYDSLRSSNERKRRRDALV